VCTCVLRNLFFGRVSGTGNRHPIPLFAYRQSAINNKLPPKPTPKPNPNPTLALALTLSLN